MEFRPHPMAAPAPPVDPGLAPVLATWQALRRGPALPRRRDLDPVALGRFLPSAGLVERGGAGAMRFRLAGAGIAALMGHEARGMPLRALFAPAARGRLQELAHAVFDTPAILHLRVVRSDSDPAEAVGAEMLLLPLGDGAGAATRALLCLDPALRVSTPVRLGIDAARLDPVGSRRPRPRRPSPALRVIPGGRGA